MTGQAETPIVRPDWPGVYRNAIDSWRRVVAPGR